MLSDNETIDSVTFIKSCRLSNDGHVVQLYLAGETYPIGNGITDDTARYAIANKMAVESKYAHRHLFDIAVNQASNYEQVLERIYSKAKNERRLTRPELSEAV
jgi:hypothetical protein